MNKDTSFRKKTFFILVFSILIIGVLLRVYNLHNVKQRTPDENIYTMQAKAVALDGIKGMRGLVREYNMNERLWIYPPPTRVGYICLLSSLMEALSSLDIKVGSYASCFFSIMSLFLLVALGLNSFNRWITLYALLFMSTSPMELAIARRTWQDAMMGFIGVSLIYFCCRITQGTKRLTWFVFFIITGSYIILVKESSSVIYALFVMWILWVLFFRERSRAKTLIFTASCIIGAGLSLAFLSYAMGGLPSVIEILKHVKEAMPHNEYAIQYQSGPWYRFFTGFWILDGLNTFLCLVGIGTVFFDMIPESKEAMIVGDKNSIRGITLFSVTFMIIAAVIPYCQNLRYVSILYIPFYLLSGLGLWRIVTFLKARLSRLTFFFVAALLVIVLIVAAAQEYRKFIYVFIKRRNPDLSIQLLIEQSR